MRMVEFSVLKLCFAIEKKKFSDSHRYIFQDLPIL